MRGTKYIDVKRISRSEGNVMAAALLSTISEYFADPKHQQEFEAWKRSREREGGNRQRGEGTATGGR